MSDAKTVFKWGCLGCLGLLGLGIVITAGLAGTVWLSVENEVPTTTTASREPTDVVAALGTDAGAGTGLLLQLDIDYADVFIEPVPAEREFSVEAKYDERTFAFEESRDSSPEGGAVWTLTFRKTSFAPFAGLRRLFGGTRSEIHIEVPLGVPFSIAGVVQNGALQGEVGGTTLRNVELEGYRGAIILSVDEPLAEPMHRFAVETSQGANIITNIGNASPREVSIGCTMGGCVIDFDGEWRNDATISLDASMSGAVISISEDVTVTGLEGVKNYDSRDMQPSDPEIALPALRFTVDGEWEFQ